MAKSKKKKRSNAAAKKLTSSALAVPLLLNQAIKPISDEYEMLFLKNSSKPLQCFQSSDDHDLTNDRESDEFYTIDYKRMSADERRQYRRKTDLRNRLKSNMDKQFSTVAEPPKQLCYPNMSGYCDQLSVHCSKSHEMRPQRILKFCKQSIVNNGIVTCLKDGNKCVYMHQNEFPCKQYYLGAKKHDFSTCQWMHSGPLSNEWRDILINYILTKQNKFGSIKENTIRQQFDEQHRKLVKLSLQSESTSATLTNDNDIPAASSTTNRPAINCDDDGNDVSIFDDISLQQSPPFYGFESFEL